MSVGGVLPMCDSLPMLRAAFLTLALLLSVPSSAAAQGNAATIQPLTHVRLSVTSPESIRVLAGSPLTAKQLRRDQFIGTLQGRRDDDVIVGIRSPESELAIPIRSVTRLEASLGKHGRAGRGALIGMGAGLVGGVAAGMIVCAGGNCESSGFTHETAIVSTVLGLGGLVVGTGVGAITGSLIRSERWRAIPVQDLPYGDGLSPENGFRLGLALPTPFQGDSGH